MVVCFHRLPSTSCTYTGLNTLRALLNLTVKGTFGPMASAFSVCALVQSWRVVVPPGADEAQGIDVPDPKWYAKKPVSLWGAWETLVFPSGVVCNGHLTLEDPHCMMGRGTFADNAL